MPYRAPAARGHESWEALHEENLVAGLGACAGGRAGAASAENVSMSFLTADGVGKSAGSISVKDTKGGLQFTPNLKGLPPGEHGFHVHEKRVLRTRHGE